ncbi:transmembrane protein 186 isoform X2 [Antennarius striatus]|uniref:transmembrane protein 186 isoform X2 n=1 Tax=Antennarius striatus TaxID=241820 RepID=UPI0035B3B49E
MATAVLHSPFLNIYSVRSVFLQRLMFHIPTCTRGPCLFTEGRPAVRCNSEGSPIKSLDGPLAPKVSALVRSSDLEKKKFTMIYTLPHIKVIRVLSRLKLLQTGITVVVLPPVFILYHMGEVPFFLVSYTTGLSLFACVMLYATSHFFRRVVGMMYLDSSQTTLKVSHLTFWGRRHDIYMPVSDVMTFGDTGDSVNETILKLKRHGSPQTFYFSTRFGLVVDKQGFQKVFGSLE